MGLGLQPQVKATKAGPKSGDKEKERKNNEKEEFNT